MQFSSHLRSLLVRTLFVMMFLQVFLPAMAQRIPVTPENAVLKDSLKNEVAKAPFDFSAMKPEMLYKITAKGYEDIQLSFESSKKGISFPGSVVDCDPCLVEYKGSPFDENVEATASFRMRKKVQEKRQTFLIGVMTPRVDMPSETVAAMVNGRKIKLNNRDIHETMGYIHNLTHPLLYGLNNPFIDAYDFDEKKKDLTRMYMAKILVKPVIKSFAYRLNGKLLREYTGPATITCEWQFVYATDTTKVLGSITTKTSLYRSAPDNDLPMRLMIYEAAKDLGASDTIFSFLERLEKTYMKQAVSPPTTLTRVADKSYPAQKEMLKGVSGAVVTIKHEEGFGSGIIIDPSGIILTSHHVVIDDTSGLMVRIEGSEELVPAKVLLLNTDYDIALLELPKGKYPALSLNTSEAVEIGDAVFAIGTPIDQTLGQSVTKGIVSGFRTINGVNFIQTDVSINSGNSGGALVSESGKLIGIATMKAAGKGIEGLGFCIPSATIEQALQLKYKP